MAGISKDFVMSFIAPEKYHVRVPRVETVLTAIGGGTVYIDVNTNAAGAC